MGSIRPPIVVLWPLPVPKRLTKKLHKSSGIGTLESVKRRQYSIIGGVVLLSIILVYIYRQDLGLIGPRTTGSGTGSDLISSSSARPPHISWQTVNRPKDGFKVEMPTDVKEIQLPAYNESGGSESINMIYSNPDGATTFSVTWADGPPVLRVNNHSPDRTLDMARDGALIRTQTSLLHESRSALGGNPARDLEARNSGGGVIDTRLLLAGNRLYMLSAVFPSASARREQDVTRFFNSFKPSEASAIPESMPAANAPASSN